MRLNAQFPTRFIGDDPAKMRDWAQAAEDLGYSYIEVADHVFGAAARGDWKPRYDENEPFHETFTMLGFLAACTSTIRLSSGVLILPQRQTGVVAKQAAEVDILSGGRFRLGVGVGWNHVEYEALDCDWKTRGAKQAEQIEVMRRLWTGDLVSYKGRFHEFEAINIKPAPIKRDIPIWLGGSADAVIRRAARLGDGWMPILPPNTKTAEKLDFLKACLKEYGRDPATFGLEAWLRADEHDPDRWAADAKAWEALGVEMAMLYPMFNAGGVDGQIQILREFKDAVSG